MGKRSDFKRRKHDAYFTPIEAVWPLLEHLPPDFTFAEPCAGDGRLARHFDELTDSRAICSLLSDLEPADEGIGQADAMEVAIPYNTDLIITNPPWTRKILHPMIERFRNIRPTWLLFDGDWMFTKQARPYLQYCAKIVATPRIKWIEDSPYSAKDNTAWYLFESYPCDPVFYNGN